MQKRDVTVSCYDDGDGGVFYLLPSGFEKEHILVYESPTDLSVEHITDDKLATLDSAVEEPFVAIGNEELGAPLGESVVCPNCGKEHPSEKVYLAGIDGRSIMRCAE